MLSSGITLGIYYENFPSLVGNIFILVSPGGDFCHVKHKNFERTFLSRYAPVSYVEMVNSVLSFRSLNVWHRKNEVFNIHGENDANKFHRDLDCWERHLLSDNCLIQICPFKSRVLFQCTKIVKNCVGIKFTKVGGEDSEHKFITECSVFPMEFCPDSIFRDIIRSSEDSLCCKIKQSITHFNPENSNLISFLEEYIKVQSGQLTLPPGEKDKNLKESVNGIINESFEFSRNVVDNITHSHGPSSNGYHKIDNDYTRIIDSADSTLKTFQDLIPELNNLIHGYEYPSCSTSDAGGVIVEDIDGQMLLYHGVNGLGQVITRTYISSSQHYTIENNLVLRSQQQKSKDIYVPQVPESGDRGITEEECYYQDEKINNLILNEEHRESYLCTSAMLSLEGETITLEACLTPLHFTSHGVEPTLCLSRGSSPFDYTMDPSRVADRIHVKADKRNNTISNETFKKHTQHVEQEDACRNPSDRRPLRHIIKTARAHISALTYEPLDSALLGDMTPDSAPSRSHSSRSSLHAHESNPAKYNRVGESFLDTITKCLRSTSGDILLPKILHASPYNRMVAIRLLKFNEYISRHCHTTAYRPRAAGRRGGSQMQSTVGVENHADVEVEVDEFHPYTFLVNSLQYQWCRHSQSPHSCMSSTATPYGWLFAFLPTHFTSSLCTNASRSNGRGSAERTMSYPIPGGRVTVWFPEMRIRTVFKDRTILDLFPGEKVRSLFQPLILRSMWPYCSGSLLISP